MNCRAVIVDLDGTVLPRGGSISENVYRTFRLLGERKVLRIVATGRNLFSALKVLGSDFPIDYLVFSSGAGVMRWNDRKMLAVHHLKESETRKIASYLWDCNVNFTIQQAIPDNHHFYYTSLYPQHADFLKRVEIYQEYGEMIHSVEDIHGEATQFVVIVDGGKLRLLEEMRARLKDYSVVRSTSPLDNQALWLEIFAAGINKGTVCSRLLQGLDIDCQDCAGLGNDYNDVDFLDICGQGFLVQNAPYRLKPYYKSVASDRNDGFVEFIKCLIPDL